MEFINQKLFWENLYNTNKKKVVGGVAEIAIAIENNV